MKKFNIVLFFYFFAYLFSWDSGAAESKFKVLVVMSYDDQYEWSREEIRGINRIFSSCCDVKYVYLDGKRNKDLVKQKAAMAYEIYKSYRPDGVVACDDDAQLFFVIPYLRDKVKTPVMFCGVNEDPKQYEYPASNVSGIFEVEPIAASLLLAMQLMPNSKSFSFVSRKDSTGNGICKQLQKESSAYPLKLSGMKLVETLEEAIESSQQFAKSSSFLFYGTMEGIKDARGKSYSEKEVLKILTAKIKKPFIATGSFRVEFGALAGVIKTGEEQGEVAATMLLQAMRGTPLSKIPMTTNKLGRRLVNVDKLSAYDLKLPPALVRGVDLKVQAK